MRSASSLAILLTCLLLAGCGATSSPTVASTPTASPAASAADPSAVPSAAPANPTAALESLCADMKAFKKPTSPTAFQDALQPLLGTLTPAAVKGALEQVNKASGMTCFVADAAPEGQPPLLLAGFRFSDQRLIAWQQEGKWQTASFKPLSDMSQILAQNSGPSGREVLFATSAEGTGHYGSFGLLRFAGGGPQLLFQSPTYDHFGATLLDPDHVLVLARNVGDAPLAWSYNAATPTNYQWLWSRKGDSFVLSAERLVPDPAYTVNVFFGALQQHKEDWLAKVGTPAAIASARQLKLDNPGVKFFPPNAMSVNAKDEYLYWTALPAANRGPAPTPTTGTATMEVQNGSVPMLRLGLQRQDTGWVISSVEAVR